jgi:hypothetical protein
MNKNIIGISIILILFVLFSQAKTFNFLIDTPLGRILLILLIVISGYINNILGIVIVLLLIIFINQNTIYYNNFNVSAYNNSDYIEGLTTQSSGPSSVETKPKTAKPKSAKPKTTTTSTAIAGAGAVKENFTPLEGYNFHDKERTILIGKQSNTYPTSLHQRTQTENVSPSSYSNILKDSFLISDYQRV